MVLITFYANPITDTADQTQQRQSIPNSTAPKKLTGKRPTELSSTVSKKKISYTEQTRPPSGHSPSPIAVITSSSHSSRMQRPLIRSSESPAHSTVQLPHKQTTPAHSKPTATTSTSEPRNETGKDSDQETEISARKGSSELDSLAGEQENFISVYARKLTSDILEEMQHMTGRVDSDSRSSEMRDELEDANHEGTQDIQSGSDPNARSLPSSSPPLMESEHKVRETGDAERERRGLISEVTGEESMHSKSSTIFVDMSNLSIQQEET